MTTMAETLNGRNNERIKLTQAAAFQIVAWLIAGLLLYGAIQARVSVVETQQLELRHQLERIEVKVDRLLAMPHADHGL